MIQTPCACTKEEDCPSAAWPGCVGRLAGDLTAAPCSKCTYPNATRLAQTWHLDGQCLRCRDAEKRSEGGK